MDPPVSPIGAAAAAALGTGVRSDAGTGVTGLRGRHVVVARGTETGFCGIAAHTRGIVEHLTRARASVSVFSPLSGALTGTLARIPDVVVAVTPGLAGAAAAARLARRHRAPLVLVAHDLVGSRRDGAGGRGLTVAAAAERRLLRAAAEVGVVRPDLAAVVQEAGITGERVHLLPHWAPAAQPPQQHAARRTLGWPVRPFTVVLSGAGSRPDLSTVSAAGALLPDDVEIVMLVDGVRPRAVPVRPGGTGRIRHVGPLDDAGYDLALAAADVLVVADRADAYADLRSSTLAHQLAAGRPIVAATADDGAVAAEVLAAGAGTVIRPGEAPLLAGAIRALQSDAPARTAMGRAARDYAVGRFDRSGTMRALDVMLLAALDPGLGVTVMDLTTA